MAGESAPKKKKNIEFFSIAPKCLSHSIVCIDRFCRLDKSPRTNDELSNELATNYAQSFFHPNKLLNRISSNKIKINVTEQLMSTHHCDIN